MKAKTILLTSLVGFALAVAACGGDSGDEGSQPNAANSAGGSQLAAGEAAGLVLPGQHLQFGGRTFELVEVIDVTTVDEGDFAETGEATSVALDSSGSTVFERDGDDVNVYTFEQVDGDGAELSDNWLKWKPAS